MPQVLVAPTALNGANKINFKNARYFKLTSIVPGRFGWKIVGAADSSGNGLVINNASSDYYCEGVDITKTQVGVFNKIVRDTAFAYTCTGTGK
jgi:hypothetical protein